MRTHRLAHQAPVHGISQARTLEGEAISSSRGSSQPRDQTRASCIFCTGRRVLYHWATREAERRVISNRWHLNDHILDARFSFMFTFSFKPAFASLWRSRWLSCTEFSCQWRRNRRHEFDLCVGKISWRRKWQPPPVFLPGKSHGQRSLVEG